MRLAPLVRLPQNSLRLRLAFLIDDFLKPPIPEPKPATMSCWRLGYKIAANLFLAVCGLAFAAMVAVGGPYIMWMMVYNDERARWAFGIIFGTAAVYGFWSHFRMTKRLHVLKRRLCPLLVLSA